MDLKEKISIIQNLLSVNKYSEAIKNCNKLIKQFPNIPYVYNLCGLAHQGNRQMLKSIELFSKALHFEPSNIAAKNNIANSYKHINQNDKAEAIFKSIISDDPKNIKALNNLMNLEVPKMTYTCETVVQLAKDEDVVINFYYTPRRLTNNSLVFDKEIMTGWWDEGYHYAKDKNFKTFKLVKGRKAKLIKKD